jgi:hypothetical protein
LQLFVGGRAIELFGTSSYYSNNNAGWGNASYYSNVHGYNSGGAGGGAGGGGGTAWSSSGGTQRHYGGYWNAKPPLVKSTSSGRVSRCMCCVVCARKERVLSIHFSY